MNKKFLCLVKLVIGLSFVVGASATALGEEFYKGKTLRFIVGFSVGGGFDTYTRLIGRHIGKYIPGNPSTIVENMIGERSLVAANHMYKVAKPDGFTVGNWHGNLVMQQILGKETIKFDARKFKWIGVPFVPSPVCALTMKRGITSVEEWLTAKEPVRIGVTDAVGSTIYISQILRAALKLPIRVVGGFRDLARIRQAAERGKIAGGCWSWESMRVIWRHAIESGVVRVVIQALPKKHPQLPKVPNAIDLAKTNEARHLIQAMHDLAATSWAYTLPPGTPKGKVMLLRKGFMDTMKDPKFLAEAMKYKLEINPLSGEEVEHIIARFFNVGAALKTRLRNILAANIAGRAS